MSLPAFIQSLFESGEARVPTIADAQAFGGEAGPVLIPPDERDDAIAMLVRYEAVVRAGWTMRAPAFDVEVGLRSAAFLYQAARLILSRHVPGEVVSHVLEHDGIDSNSPSAHYSVDLSGRYLPDLFRMAGGRLTGDPLADRLSRFGARWPLSSIGMPGTIPDTQRLATVLDHPSLHASYIDRALERSDTPRLEEPRVAEAAHRVTSVHPGLVSRSMQQAIEQQLVLSLPTTNEELS